MLSSVSGDAYVALWLLCLVQTPASAREQVNQHLASRIQVLKTANLGVTKPTAQANTLLYRGGSLQIRGHPPFSDRL
jgi:hypothetical protein